MASDSSQVVYSCPFCREYFLDEKDCRDHIRDTPSGGHSGKNGHTMDTPIEVLHPQVDEIDFGKWEERVAEWIEDAAYLDGTVEVEGTLMHDETGLPKPYVRFEAERQGYTVVDSQGRSAGDIVKSWDDLTDKYKETVLAAAYYPDYTYAELVEEGLSGYNSQGTTSNAVRLYSWMFAHPDVETPIEPTEGEPEEGTVTTNGDVDTMLEGLEGSESEEPEEPEEPETVECPDCGMTLVVSEDAAPNQVLGPHRYACSGHTADGPTYPEEAEVVTCEDCGKELPVPEDTEPYLVMGGHKTGCSGEPEEPDEDEDVPMSDEGVEQWLDELDSGGDVAADAAESVAGDLVFPEGASSPGEPRGSRPEEAAPAPSISGVDVALESDEAFEAFAALIETQRLQVARDLFEKVLNR